MSLLNAEEQSASDPLALLGYNACAKSVGIQHTADAPECNSCSTKDAVSTTAARIRTSTLKLTVVYGHSAESLQFL